SPCRRAPFNHGIHAALRRGPAIVRIQLFTNESGPADAGPPRYASLSHSAPDAASPATVVVAIVGVGNAVMVSVAPGTTLVVAVSLVLIAIGNAVAVAIPPARHEPPVLAAADILALPRSGHVAVARTRRDPLAASPDVAVVHQHVVTRRPDIA